MPSKRKKKDEIKPQRKQSRKFNLKLDRLPQRGSWATLQALQQQRQQLQPHDMYKNNKYIYIVYIYSSTYIYIFTQLSFICYTKRAKYFAASGQLQAVWLLLLLLLQLN